MSSYTDIRQDEKAERVILAGCLWRPESLYEALQMLTPDSFAVSEHREIFQAITDLVSQKLEVSLHAVQDQLKRSGKTRETRGDLYDALFTAWQVSRSNFASALLDVRECEIRRGCAALAGDLMTDSGDPLVTADEVLSRAEHKLSLISGVGSASQPQTLADLSDGFFEQMTRARESGTGVTGLATGIERFDRMTTGLKPGQLVILAGRPSMGKSALAMTMALNVARSGGTVAFFSMEMSKEELATRAYSGLARVSATAIQGGRVTDDQVQALYRARGEFESLPLVIDDTSGITPLQLQAKAWQIKQRRGLSLVVVDYLQLMHAPRSQSREQEVSTISRQLKQLSQELSVPVLALSQMNRSVETRQEKRPILSDLRESGSLEQDSSIVCFCYRPEYYKITVDTDNTPTEGRGWLIIAKHRNGPIGEVICRFEKETMMWLNESTRDDAPAHYSEARYDVEAF